MDPLTPLKLQEHFDCVVVANSLARKEKAKAKREYDLRF